MTRTHLDNIVPLTDAQRTEVERQAFNFHRDYGRKLQVPPTFAHALRAAGVSMVHIEPNPALEQ